MFTGIIKAKGIIGNVEARSGDTRLSVQSSDLAWETFDVGESIAVNGVCLTAVSFRKDGFDADASRETMAVTALGNLSSGSQVNLEPSLAVGDRLGGHLVSGHVDCVGTVTSRSKDARSERFAIDVPPEYRRYLARKGSVCVDGVSLTVNAVSENSFEVNIIPHTIENTIIDGYQAGTAVNIEVDMLARYLERMIGEQGDDGITRDFLREHGYG